MKSLYLSIALLIGSELFAQTIEYKMLTTVESIVPGGLGRSRIIENNQEMDYKQFTTTRVDGNDSSSK